MQVKILPSGNNDEAQLMSVKQGMALTVNRWPQASKNSPKRFKASKTTSQHLKVNIWGYSCFKTSFPSRMSQSVFEINVGEYYAMFFSMLKKNA